MSYQEQVIEIFRQSRRATRWGRPTWCAARWSKKKVKDIEKERGAFLHGDPARGIVGCEANGIPTQVAESIYNEMYDFANYAFNKAHSVCYAVIAYQTAWFKCYYPRQYMAALMTSVLRQLNEDFRVHCRVQGDGNCRAAARYQRVERPFYRRPRRASALALPLSKTSDAGLSRRSWPTASRRRPFTGLENFCQRMYGADLNKRALENLIKCGACDCFGLKRSQLLQIYEAVMDTVAAGKRKNVDGQIGLFDLGGSDDDAPRSRGARAGSSRACAG